MYKGQIRLGNLCQVTFWKSDLCLDTYVKIVISCLFQLPCSLMKYPALQKVMGPYDIIAVYRMSTLAAIWVT